MPRIWIGRSEYLSVRITQPCRRVWVTASGAAAGKAVAPDPPRPDPEVVASAKRREGLYSSHLVTWRREREAGILKGMTPHKRGTKSKRNPQEEEMQNLRRENHRLTGQLRKAEIVIDVRKKVGALLGALRQIRILEKEPTGSSRCVSAGGGQIRSVHKFLVPILFRLLGIPAT